MEMKYYNPSNNFSAPLPREPKPYTPRERQKTEVVVPREPESEKKSEEAIILQENQNLAPCSSGGLEGDDILLLALIFILLANGCKDYLLLGVLGYLFFTGRSGKDKENNAGQMC